MGQININVTPAFEAALVRLMRLRGIRSKSEAIREAVAESAERASGRRLSRTSPPGSARLSGHR